MNNSILSQKVNIKNKQKIEADQQNKINKSNLLNQNYKMKLRI